MGSPQGDMFATVHNTQPCHPTSCLHFRSYKALAVDALSQPWQGLSMYMFPPFSLLSKVIQKLGATRFSEVILIIPWWQPHPWFSHLIQLSVDQTRFLPYHQDLLSQQGYTLDRTESHIICTHGCFNIAKL